MMSCSNPWLCRQIGKYDNGSKIRSKQRNTLMPVFRPAISPCKSLIRSLFRLASIRLRPGDNCRHVTSPIRRRQLSCHLLTREGIHQEKTLHRRKNFVRLGPSLVLFRQNEISSVSRPTNQYHLLVLLEQA